MAEDDLLRSISRRFIKDLGTPPNWWVNIDISSYDVIFGSFWLLVLLDRTMEAFSKDFEKTSCKMAILRKFHLISLDWKAGVSIITTV